ncbi:MAG: hypothetical protein KDC35_00975 [Acidobacteria bacterium]|nr:hypothetical protein [Acidobacteriota bacterium]
MPLTLFKKGSVRGEWYVATIRVEPSTASNYYGVSISFGLLGHTQEREIQWVPRGQPSFDVMVSLAVPFLRTGFNRAKRPRKYVVEKLTLAECRVLHAARKQVFGEQIPLFWSPPPHPLTAIKTDPKPKFHPL